MKIGIFTVASRNYLAYVRVLFDSVAAAHPEMPRYLCLVDTIDDCFNPDEERFQVIRSDRIGVPYFEDMALRYDIMEFNTAVKPFMFQWLFDNTDLDAVIYLDPDIRVYSRMTRVTEMLDAGASMILTPHITRPLEDGRNPNDHHMLQTGVFNLGFAAISRCGESRDFLQWWSRRMQTQACADFPRNLFTDQRWCDLAPCFLNQLQILKDPAYNVAYWNLAERTVAHDGADWQCNGHRLVFFHFSGLAADDAGILSRHQNRFSLEMLPACAQLFHDYRLALAGAGWDNSKNWSYAYSRSGGGLPLAPAIRHLYRQEYPEPQDFRLQSADTLLLRLCRRVVPVQAGLEDLPMTRLMQFIYERRSDLQAAFQQGSRRGMRAFRAWFGSAGAREYKLSGPLLADDRIQEGSAAAPAGPDSRSSGAMTTSALAGWERLPAGARARLAPLIFRLTAAVSAEVAGAASGNARLDTLQDPAPPPQLPVPAHLITDEMHRQWLASAELQRVFNLQITEHQRAFAAWCRVTGPARPSTDSVSGLSAAR
jgi:hypothetical protein